jgi:hypothetical protein
MEKMFNKVCQFVGLRLLTLGSQLCGFTVVSMYSEDNLLHAIYFATGESKLN